MYIDREDMFTSFELSKKLCELGFKQSARFTWVYDTVNETWDISGMPVEAHKLIDKDRECYSAFSIPELGEFLHNHSERLWARFLSRINSGNSISKVATNPGFYARFLIDTINHPC